MSAEKHTLHAECQQKRLTLHAGCQQKNARVSCRMSAEKRSRVMQNVSTKAHTLHADCQQQQKNAHVSGSGSVHCKDHFLAIFATELGESNANIKTLLKKNSLCGFTVPISSI